MAGAISKRQRSHNDRLRAAREAADRISDDLIKVLLANKERLLCVASGGTIIYARPGALRPARR